MPSCFETSHTSPSFILTTSFRAVTEIHTPLKETMVALHFNAPHMHSYIVIFKCTNCQGLQLLIWWRFHYIVIFLDLLLLVVPTEGVTVVTSNSNCYNLLLSTLQCVISHVFITLINEECPMLPNYTLNLKLNIILWRPYTHQKPFHTPISETGQSCCIKVSVNSPFSHQTFQEKEPHLQVLIKAAALAKRNANAESRPPSVPTPWPQESHLSLHAGQRYMSACVLHNSTKTKTMDFEWGCTYTGCQRRLLKWVHI